VRGEGGCLCFAKKTNGKPSLHFMILIC
jgi:hypothetical protein